MEEKAMQVMKGVKPNVVNWIGALIGAALAWWTGLPPLAQALLIVQGADILTGLLCAVTGKSRKTESGKVSSGALLMGATFLVGRIKGVSRPALAPVLPSAKEAYMLLDSGANADCRPEMLLQFARMGSIYMRRMFPERGEPRVGLLNVGTEDTKGGELQQAVFPLLRDSGLRFIGNIEARDVPLGAADVVVADGFSGNVLLKTMEGTSQLIMGLLKDGLTASLRTKLGAALVMPALRGLKKKMSTSEYGGAVLLGVKCPVIKAHGNAKAKDIVSAVRVAASFAESGAVDEIAAAVRKTDKTETKESDG